MGRVKGCIMCLNTGVVYQSCAEACRALNIPDDRMSKVINGRLKEYKGLCFVMCESDARLSELAQFRADQLRNVYKLYNISACGVSFYGVDTDTRIYD